MNPLQRIEDNLVRDICELQYRGKSQVRRMIGEYRKAVISEAVRLVEAGAGINGRQDIIRDLTQLKENNP